MPFMCVGSLQSIISSSFSGRLPKPCIVVVLKETFNAISYLHNQGHLHSDIKVGNILIDPDGSAKLVDFGVSASVYKANSRNKVDIWSFGIMVLELARGSPSLSNLLPSKSLLLKITKRFWFLDYETHNKDFKNKCSRRLSRTWWVITSIKTSDFLMKNVLLGLPSVERGRNVQEN
ncbi:serine/threonine-protein kinase BLUS1-like [Pyrus ussuriensis x Pyrus communis]|uniref:Serine/threonine-protein kinase BLUS1-like n=1 Tax=Pyrus ussuriensis x Pyrus communis TaxID=2448454 RepID=A0A5N5F9P6_9ROSA|nr:serine/threonine-protein kinase BLUS1-like [Pyrus ussuriensis x Pyrus communis]